MSNYQHNLDVRAGAHSDYGSISLLFQRPGQHGLEILTPEETWASVPVWPSSSSSKGECGNGARGGHGDVGARNNSLLPPILINIGDALSYWTDGLLKSTVHRVVFPHSERDPSAATGVAANLVQDRYSIVFFCQPVNDTELVPVPSAVVAAHRQHQSVLTTTKIGYGGGAGSLQPGKKALTAKELLVQRLAATYQFEKEGIRPTTSS
jgi:isopenicillin N synthase-like dioxygenase